MVYCIQQYAVPYSDRLIQYQKGLHMKEDFYEINIGGRIPTGLPGGFFIYEAEGDETILVETDQ